MSALRQSMIRALRINDPTPDAALVRAVAGGDADAVQSLIARHGPMVLRVCRHVLGDEHAAEDAFQAVFLVLMRRAGSIRRPERITAWLFATARRIAVKAKRATARRRCRETQRTVRQTREAIDDLTVRELLVALDEEIERLPEEYRLPLLLCYWQGLTQNETARRLGWSTGSVKGRLERGRKMLGARLTKRGFAPSALLAMSVMKTALSGELLAKTAALTVSGALVPAGVLALTAGTGTGKGATAMAITVLLAGVGIVGLAGGFGSAKSPVSADPPPPPPVAQQDKPAEARTMRVIVLDPDGKSLPGANVHVGIWINEKDYKYKRDYETDQAGAALIELPKTFYILRLWASKKQLVSMFAGWEQDELASGKSPPEEYTFRLEKAVTAGGRVLDEQGKPIAGANVQMMLNNVPKPAHSDGRMRYAGFFASSKEPAITDADGRWRVENVPNHPDAMYRLLVSHPDHVSDEIWGEAQKAAGITTRMLRDESADIRLKQGVIVRGYVTDPNGKPIKDAVVIDGDRPYFSSNQARFLTDADGQFRLPAKKPEQRNLTVMAPGWAPQMRKLNLQADLPPQAFRMTPGKSIKLHVVDSAGKPFPKAYVTIRGWRGSESIQSLENPNQPKVGNLKIPGRTDSDGNWEWTWAPDDPVKLSVSLPGYANVDLEIAGGEPVRTVTLNPEHRIVGRVVDAVTGQQIPAFSTIPVQIYNRGNLVAAIRDNGRSARDGRFEFEPYAADYCSFRLRIEAMGYRSQDGPEFRYGDDSSRTQDFRLQPSKPITGVVLDAAGQPAANAEVLLAVASEWAEMRSEFRGNKTRTDSAGRFSFPDPGTRFIVASHTDAGYAQAEFLEHTHDAGTLRLQPWASIRGVFRDGGQPVKGATIFLRAVSTRPLNEPRIDFVPETVTGPDGRFRFDRVPPIPCTVQPYLGPWRDDGFRSSPNVPLDLRSGQQVELDLGGTGATVTGKVKLTGKVPADLDCTYSINHLVRREPGIAPPPEIAKLGFDARKGWRDSWQKTGEGQTFFSTLNSWYVKLAPDGSFRISGVPAGDYDLAVAVYAKPSGCLIDPLARSVARVKVTDADFKAGRLEVPEITAEVVPVPEIGDMASLSFVRSDGADGTLADHRGKYTLVHFWASWCGPCKQQLPAVRQLHDKFNDKGLVALGLSLDEDAAAWQKALDSLKLPWQQGRLAAGNDAGVSSVPAYWLLDPAGKIVAKVYDTNELAKAIGERVK